MGLDLKKLKIDDFPAETNHFNGELKAGLIIFLLVLKYFHIFAKVPS